MAPGSPACTERMPRRYARAAEVDGAVAALGEAAARESLRERWHGAADDGERAAALRRAGERIEKLARIGMRRRGKESIATRRLDDLARVHHCDAVSDL